MTIYLQTKPGINGANTLSVPDKWDKVWFRRFIANLLKGADVRNAVGENGIVVSGNISSPYATISTGGTGPATFASLVVGTPTGGNEGAGSINAQSIFVNGVPVTGGGGGSSLFNVTIDSHPSVPTGVGLGPNDEFETGTTIDTSGTRYSGATAWTWFNQTTSTAVIAAGSLLLSGPNNSAASTGFVGQPVPGTSAWRYRTKFSADVQTQFNNGGLGFYESSTGKYVTFGLLNNSATPTLWVGNALSLTGAVGAITSSPFAAGWPYTLSLPSAPLYFEAELAAGVLFFRFSNTGFDNTFSTFFSINVATYFTVAPDNIGFGVDTQSASSLATLQIDWFRREA